MLRSAHPVRVITPLLALLLAATPLVAASRAIAATLDLNAKGLTDNDKVRYSYNKPAELFAFWCIKDGMKVMDLFPGNGYLTLLLTQVVGAKGRVVGFASYDHESFDKRFKPLGLANLEEFVMPEPQGFGSDLTTALAKLPAGSFDAVVTIRNYHDLKNPVEALSEIKRILKTGGTLGIIDSRTASGRRREPPHRRRCHHPRGPAGRLQPVGS